MIISILLLSLNISTGNVFAKNKKSSQTLMLGKSKVVFADLVQATTILSDDDEYFTYFSKFDNASRFKALKPLNKQDRKKFYGNAVRKWSSEDKNKVIANIKEITGIMKRLKMKFPKEIIFIRTDGSEEGGAAYTRKNAIVLPENMKITKEIITHEFFHVLSRYNKNLRDKIYGVINFKRCGELVYPDVLKDFTLVNPDAANNNYYISGKYRDKMYDFIPILYSTEPYDITSDIPFFYTLKDDMLAVNIVNSKPVVIYDGDKPLIVKKNSITDFKENIGLNTDYTYSPEEIMADNFVIMILGYNVPSQWVIDALSKLILN